MKALSGKVALITGAGGGIGRAMALAFSAEGAAVIVSDIDEKLGKETERQVKSRGGEANFIQADVSNDKDVDALISGSIKAYSALDCACNNAGTEGKIASLVDQTIENYDTIMSVNARGVFLCLKAEINHMMSNGGGSIVNTASIAGLIGFPGLSPYVASKHAVNGLTKNAALEYAAKNIRVNSICPGGVDTRMLDSLADQSTGGQQTSKEMMSPLHPMGRIGTPEEIANLAVWLCSPAASFVTGTNIPIDGGYVAQ